MIRFSAVRAESCANDNDWGRLQNHYTKYVPLEDIKTISAMRVSNTWFVSRYKGENFEIYASQAELDLLLSCGK